MAESMIRKLSITPKNLVLIGFVTASLIVGRGFTAFLPGHGDAQLFAYIGSEWLAGVIPYVDAWDNKPPGIFATIAMVFAIFPDNFGALAVLEGILIAICNLSIFTLMRKFGAPWDAAAVATAGSAVACNLLYYNGHGVLTEIYLIGPAATSMVFFAKAFLERRLYWMFLAGICTGIASLYKPTGLSPFMAQMCFLFLLVLLKQHGWLLFLRCFVVNAFGIVIAWAPFVFYFWRHGGLFELFNATLFYNITYGASSQPGLFQSVFRVVGQLQPIATLAVCALVVSVLVANTLCSSLRAVLAREKDVAPLTLWGMLVVLWVLVDLAGAMAGGRNYAHYFLTLTPSLSLMGGLAYWTLAETIGCSPDACQARIVLAALLLGPLLFAQIHDANHLRGALTASRPKDYSDRGMEFLSNTRKPTDTMFTWGTIPSYYFTSKMRSPSRYLGADMIFDSPVTAEKMRDQILKDLEQKPPSFLVDNTANQTKQITDETVNRWFHRFTEQNYRLAFSENGLRIYELVPDKIGRTEIPGRVPPRP
jgi:Dolichyl-phosphate-mannose-protein mannosyltransferase